MKIFPTRHAGIGALALAALLAGCDRDGNVESPANDNPPVTTSAEPTRQPVPSADATSGTSAGAESANGGSGAGTQGAAVAPSAESAQASAGTPSTGSSTPASNIPSAAGAPEPTAEAGQPTNEAAAAAAAQGAAAAAASAPPAGAGAADDQTLAPEDREFLFAAATSGVYEVEAARIAAEKATDPQVRAFASMLVVEHSRSNAELNVLASLRGLILPTDMTAGKRGELDQLAKQGGADFDRQFVENVGIAAHEEAIALFENASQATSDAAVKDWIEKTLPALREHLEQARGLQAG